MTSLIFRLALAGNFLENQVVMSASVHDLKHGQSAIGGNSIGMISASIFTKWEIARTEAVLLVNNIQAV